MNFLKTTIWLFIFYFILSHSVPKLSATETELFYFQRLTGIRPNVMDSIFLKAKQLIAEGKTNEAISIILEHPAFIDVKVKDFATRMIAIDELPYGQLNDAIALVMGVIRDNHNGQHILTGDFSYIPMSKITGGLVPAYFNNLVYQSLAERFSQLSKYLQLTTPQWNFSSAHSAAGILTTRGWGEIYYSAGTNRRAVMGAFQAFLCTPIEKWRVANLPSTYIRKDVDRLPGGNPQTFNQECRVCHGPMDAMGGAFSQLDFKNNALTFYPEIAPKYNQNTDVYPEGYATDSDYWENYLAQFAPSQGFGWRGEIEGFGVHDFAKMMATSEGFSKCMAKRVFKSVCYQDLELSDETVKTLAKNFEQESYNFKKLFKAAVMHESCVQ